MNLFRLEVSLSVFFFNLIPRSPSVFDLLKTAGALWVVECRQRLEALWLWIQQLPVSLWESNMENGRLHKIDGAFHIHVRLSDGPGMFRSCHPLNHGLVQLRCSALRQCLRGSQEVPVPPSQEPYGTTHGATGGPLNMFTWKPNYLNLFKKTMRTQHGRYSEEDM